MTRKTNRIERLADGHYLTTYVDVCRNCKGKGQVIARDPREDGVPVEICSVCEGSGRVVVTKEIYIKVEPYKTT